jgi:membrane protease YdiL (CAAX protease family)
MSIIRRWRLAAFFVLAYAFAWCLVPFGGLFLPVGPLLAALIVVSVTDGRRGLRALGSRMIRWRVGWIWYAVALGLPLAVLLITTGLNVALGAPAPSSGQFTPWYAVLLLFASRLVDPLDGPLGEEPGWRGFAQPALQTDRSPLLATAILAVLVAGWHLPLLQERYGLRPIDLLSTVAVTFWYAWLFNHTGGSALITMLSHSAQGSIVTTKLWSADADLARYSWIYAAVACAVVIGLLVFDRQLWRAPAPARATMQPSDGLPGSSADMPSASPTSDR